MSEVEVSVSSTDRPLDPEPLSDSPILSHGCRSIGKCDDGWTRNKTKGSYSLPWDPLWFLVRTFEDRFILDTVQDQLERRKSILVFMCTPSTLLLLTP